MSSLRQRYSSVANQRKTAIARPFTLNGLGVTQDAISNYSATPTDFYFQAPNNFDFFISTLILEIADNSSFTQDGYGGIPALTNGIKFFIERNGVKNFFTDPIAFKTNGELITQSNEFEIIPFAGGAQAIVYRLDFSLFADASWLNGDNADKLGVTVNDNFTSLPFHRFSVLGSTQGPKAR